MPEFKHSMGISAIKQLKQENLFTEKLRPDIEKEKSEVFFAIRPGHGSFYLKGRRLFNYEEGKGFSTHNKFSFMSSAAAKIYLTETDLKNIKPVDNFQDAYEGIKERAALYADTEATGVSALYAFAPHAKNKTERYFLVDIEVVFDAVQDQVNQDDDIVKRHSDRIDILLYDNQEQRLLFCEAKHFSNPEIWASKGKSPKVIEQLDSYDKQIAKKTGEILPAYKTAFEEYNKLMGTDLKEPKSICPKCGLLIFGFDRAGLKMLKSMIVSDKNFNGHKYRLIGGMAAYCRMKPPKNAIKDLFKHLDI